MRLNQFLWDNFIESSTGQDWVAFFANLRTHYLKRDEKLLKFVSHWASHGTMDDYLINKEEEIKGVLHALKEIEQATADKLLPAQINNQDEADFYFREISDLAPDDDEDDDLFSLDDIPRLSIALFCLHPQFFFPYYFYPNFHALRRISDEFGIFLPPIPAKRDYEGRYHYYLEICRSLHDYWAKLGFAPELLPVFLYGFAPQVIDLTYPKITELPKPHRAWFLGAGTTNGDANYLDKVNELSQTFWTGHKETEEGDVIVIYCLAPRSHIHSIWRAIRPGGVEPFRSYYGTIWMGYPQIVKPLTYTEMKNDPLLSKFPLVKGNMQGINGRNIPKEFYDRILSLLEKNGTVVGNLPRLENKEIKNLRLKTERDVETALLEPLLLELGFKPEDWERQVKLRVGRSEKVIPDYLIHTVKDKNAKTVRADWVWEAKFSIPSNEQLERDFGQASSYARLVDASGVGLISKEGVWLCSKKDDYSFKKTRHWSALQVREIDHLNEIRTLAGKKARR